MNLILVTGLDGAGKTTFLKTLSKKVQLDEKHIINVPFINLNLLNKQSDLYKTAEFVNKLSKVGDILQMPQIKAVGLFASMLLFKELLSEAKETGAGKVYCERHPLIDTSIYAKFYASKLYPESVDKVFLEKLDEKNSKELNYLLNLLPKNYIDDSKGLVENIMNFIHQWFYIEKRFSIGELKELFNLELPSEIYYLHAEPKFLFERIRKRKVLEAHETIKVLSMMEEEYKILFKKISNNNGLVEVVNIKEHSNVENLLSKLALKH